MYVFGYACASRPLNFPRNCTLTTIYHRLAFHFTFEMNLGVVEINKNGTSCPNPSGAPCSPECREPQVTYIPNFRIEMVLRNNIRFSNGLRTLAASLLKTDVDVDQHWSWEPMPAATDRLYQSFRGFIEPVRDLGLEGGTEIT